MMTRQVGLKKEKIIDLVKMCEERIEDSKRIVTASMKQEDVTGRKLTRAYAYLIRSTTRKDMASMRLISDLLVGLVKHMGVDDEVQVSPLGLRGLNRLLFKVKEEVE